MFQTWLEFVVGNEGKRIQKKTGRTCANDKKYININCVWWRIPRILKLLLFLLPQPPILPVMQSGDIFLPQSDQPHPVFQGIKPLSCLPPPSSASSLSRTLLSMLGEGSTATYLPPLSSGALSWKPPPTPPGAGKVHPATCWSWPACSSPKYQHCHSCSSRLHLSPTPTLLLGPLIPGCQVLLWTVRENNEYFLCPEVAGHHF